MPLTTVGKIGFIGGGNMAEAFIKGLMNGGFPATDILFFEPNEKRRELMIERYGVSCAVDNMELVNKSDIVVVATKPQILDKVLEDIVTVFNDEKLLISILAGITTTTFEEGLGGQARVVRAMPNTPALAGQGAAALCPGKNVTEEDRRVAQHLFETVGIALWVEEGQMDAVTGLSGSGPAFVYTFIEALTAGGVQEGLRLDIAHSLAVQTVVGAAHLVKETGEHPALLREKVCSPAGTTISAIRVLEERGLRAMMMEAVGAATARSRELGKEKK
ncbi:MAG: pyrroline-5-carboxylate reductase [Desulfuromonadales bacterium]|nr:pyrroline-5-carboxylate reductase [Desulfuromonadales bacterium]MDH3807443.1 pyrroline-5-carboxylate reductase [Desulfuromonadales bacterium]MDH3869000.1 pyrroline-5-carboxylate reductase [Desulfuromonadales bacterium]HKJ29092.1 pyrroline-5-carboxylate reductase [Desulfuromonadales bacterium]